MKKIIFSLAIGFLFITEGKSQPGTLNNKFGHNGIVKTKLNGGNGSSLVGYTRATFVQSDGKILTVLSAGIVVVINRRLADGTIDSTYGKNGYSTDVEMINPAAALQSDSEIVVVGATTTSNSDFIAARFTTDGKLDKTFGNKGVTITDAGSETDALASVAIQSNGKIVAGGQTSRNGINQFALIRYSKDGIVDSSYGSQGLVITNFGNSCNINSIALTTDNKVVAVGNYNNGSAGDFAIARYLKTGALDPTFNGNGEVTSNFGNSDNAVSVALDTAGKIVVGGYYTDPSNNSHFEIARYTTNGSLDSTFNGSGVTGTNFGNNQEYLSAIALQSNGEIIAGGNSWGGESYSELAFARFNANGSIDNSFGINGQTLDPMGSNDYDYLYFLTIGANGEIFSGGYTLSDNIGYFTLLRLDPNGSIDSSFASAGNLLYFYPGNSIGYLGAMVQNDGKIVVNGNTYAGGFSTAYFLARFNPDGTSDHTYGTNGMATTNGNAAVMQTDQKVVEVNYSIVDSTGAVGVVMSRYKVDGSPDPTYGTNGVVQDFPGVLANSALAIQPDNKVVVAGYVANDIGESMALIRYNIDGTPDATFGTGGASIPNFQFYNYPSSIAIGTDGKIIVSEVANNASGQLVMVLARFNSNGSIDSSFAQNGLLTLSPGVLAIVAYPNPVALQADGKILLNYVVSYDYNTYYNFVSRYSPSGVIDSLFGAYGTIAVDGTNGVMVEPDQKILVSGNVYDAQNNSDYSISRYNTNGSPDSTFGTNGTTITKFVQGSSLYVNGVAISNNEFIADGFGNDPLEVGILAEYHLGNQAITIDSTAVIAVVAPPSLASGGDLTITPAPNPTNSSFNIHLSSSDQLSSVTLQLINNQGMVLQTIPDLYPGQTINIGGSLHPGIYFLKVINGNSAKTIKLMKL
jgi:uncharacterized delta-60 repeat protein